MSEKAEELEPSLEEVSYVRGVYKAFQKQVGEYTALSRELLELQGRIGLIEKQVKVSRDHLCMVIEQTGGVAPEEWDDTLNSVRFVNMRLAEACMSLLEQKKVMTTTQLITALNHGMYRWRTNTPLRELNAALLRQKDVTRQDDKWIYKQLILEIPVEA